jgi:hypothetical protein
MDRPPTDDAVKIACVEATDGRAIVSYAGLGATALGNQPSEWVVNTLRGRGALTVEGALDVLAAAMQREFLPHLRQFKEVRDRQHGFLVPAFVGDEARLYGIELVATPTGVVFRKYRAFMGGTLASSHITVPIGMVGSGCDALEKREPSWQKELLHLAKAYNSGKVSAIVVRRYLANLCYYAHKNTTGGSVGPSCIVIWRNSKFCRNKWGNSHADYERTKKVGASYLPSVSWGMDVGALCKLTAEVQAPWLGEALAAMKRGDPLPPERPTDDLNDRLSRIPSKPDESLR